jgi:hypothetical protein
MAKALFVLKYCLRFDLIAVGYVRGARRRDSIILRGDSLKRRRAKREGT